LRTQSKLFDIVFTLDNFMKLVLIFLRVRCNLPIILMGETGVGKTSLVDYLSKVIDADYMTLNIHAGITDDEIIRFMNAVQAKAKEYYAQRRRDAVSNQVHIKKVMVFFDEINTN
jgi:MoxR-like ATPase